MEKGFTLIEVLVTIAAISILLSIALPSYLGFVNKSRQAEAKQYINAMNKAQQANYAEHGKFIYNKNISELKLGVKFSTENYTYSIDTDPLDGMSAIANIARPKKSDLHGYIGAVAIIDIHREPQTASVICQSKELGNATYLGLDSIVVVLGTEESDGNVQCGSTTTKLRN